MQSLVLVKKPQECDASTANCEKQELQVSILVVRELVNKDLRAGDVNKGASSDAENDRCDKVRGVLDTNTDAYTRRLNERETEENEENGFLRFSLVLAEGHSEGDYRSRMVESHSNHQVHKGAY